MAGFIQNYYRSLRANGMAKRGRKPQMSTNQFYPAKEERQLAGIVRNEFTRIMGEILEESVKGFADDADDVNDYQITLSNAFLEQVTTLGREISGRSNSAVEKQMELIIGKPYYPPNTHDAILQSWHKEFQELCISAAQDGKTKIAAVVANAKEKGWNKKQTEKAVNELLPQTTKHRAELIARTETAKLNTRCTVQTYQELGVSYYKWLACIDDRTRKNHAEMHNKICALTDDDVYFTENEKDPLHPTKHNRTSAMYHGKPGTDFQCRCCMVMWDPEIDGQYEIPEMPVEPEKETKTQKLEKENAELKAEAQNAKRQVEILQNANARHAQRTQAQRDEIQRLWDERKIYTFAQRQNFKELEKALGVKRGKPMSIEDADKQSANPNYVPEYIPDPNGRFIGRSGRNKGKRFSINPNYSKSQHKQFSINCQTCVPAYMLRLNGFNVTAKGNTEGSLSKWISYSDNSFKIWKNQDGSESKAEYVKDFMRANGYKRLTPKRYEDFFEEKCKEVGVYVVLISWKNSNGGHATILQRLDDGRLVYIEPQKYNGAVYLDYNEICEEAKTLPPRCDGILRIDDKLFDVQYGAIFDLKP